MQTNNGNGQEPFAPKTIPAAIDGLDAAIDGRIAQAGAVTADQLAAHTDRQDNPHGVTAAQIGAATPAQLAAHTDRQDNPHGVTAAQVGAITSGQLDAAIQGTRMVRLWSGSWASGSITLSDSTANYRLLVMGGAPGMMAVYPTGSVHGSTRYLWGNGGQWHVVDNLYYLVASGNTLTLAHSHKMLNGTGIGAADAVTVVYGIK